MAEKNNPGFTPDEELKARETVKRPKMYRVIMHNDHYTTMEFVIEVLVGIFFKSAAEATEIMMAIHKKGQASVGVYTLDIAQTRVEQVLQSARLNDFPLKCTYEEV